MYEDLSMEERMEKWLKLFTRKYFKLSDNPNVTKNDEKEVYDVKIIRDRKDEDEKDGSSNDNAYNDNENESSNEEEGENDSKKNVEGERSGVVWPSLMKKKVKKDMKGDDGDLEEGVRNALLNTSVKLISVSMNGRFEWIRMHYKTSYKRNECYVFQIQWLVSNAISISKYIDFLKRQAEKFGFLMVKTPFFPIDFPDEMKSNENEKKNLIGKRAFLELRSFEHHPKIELPDDRNLISSIMEVVCEKMDFYPEILPIDVNYSKRFVRCDGTVMLQIENNKELFFIVNKYCGEEVNAESFYKQLKGIVDSLISKSKKIEIMKKSLEKIQL